jgi:hypothetical protein
MVESLPPDVFGDGEIITFFPTVEFLEAQAKHIWAKNGEYSIKFSSYKKGGIIGTNPYLYTGSIDNIVRKKNSNDFKFTSDDIEYLYNQGEARFSVKLPEKTKLKIKKPVTIDSAYINFGTLLLLGGDINYSLGNSLLLSPFKDNVTSINSDFFNTTTNGYYLGVAKGVDIIKHGSSSNTVLYNSSTDFIQNCLNEFDNNQSGTTFCQLYPSFSLGTVVSRPAVVIDYGTDSVTFEPNQTDLIYDCLFLFKSSTPDYSDAFVCYAAPFENDYYIFGTTESKAMFDENLEGKALEINEIKVKTELTWEVIVI